jgi:hypothetical protein
MLASLQTGFRAVSIRQTGFNYSAVKSDQSAGVDDCTNAVTMFIFLFHAISAFTRQALLAVDTTIQAVVVYYR